MAEILALLVPWVVSTTLIFLLIHRDEARLPPEQLARAWPTATRRTAVVYFGPLALPVHFGRTRRSVLGVVQGLAWALAIGALDGWVGDGVERLANALVLH